MINFFCQPLLLIFQWSSSTFASIKREHENFMNPSFFLCKDTKYKCDVLKLIFKKIKAINHDQNGLYSACNVAMGWWVTRKDIRLKKCLRVNWDKGSLAQCTVWTLDNIHSFFFFSFLFFLFSFFSLFFFFLLFSFLGFFFSTFGDSMRRTSLIHKLWGNPLL